MTILAREIENPGADAAGFQALLRDEALAVWDLRKRDILREAWFTRRNRCAVLLLECADEDEARRCLAELPLVRAGLIRFETEALRPYDGFERLFGAQSGEAR